MLMYLVMSSKKLVSPGCRGDVDDDVDVPCVDVVDDASNWMDFVWCFL